MQVGSLAEISCRENCSTRNALALVSSKFRAAYCVFWAAQMTMMEDLTREQSGSISESAHEPLASETYEQFVTDSLVLLIQNLWELRNMNFS